MLDAINKCIHNLGLIAEKFFTAPNKEIVFRCKKPSSKIDTSVLTKSLKTINLELSCISEAEDKIFVRSVRNGDIKSLEGALKELNKGEDAMIILESKGAGYKEKEAILAEAVNGMNIRMEAAMSMEDRMESLEKRMNNIEILLKII